MKIVHIGTTKKEKKLN